MSIKSKGETKNPPISVYFKEAEKEVMEEIAAEQNWTIRQMIQNSVRYFILQYRKNPGIVEPEEKPAGKDFEI